MASTASFGWTKRTSEEIEARTRIVRGLHRSPLSLLEHRCIDQDNIDDSLASLPVFLAGCNELLVLAGRTYPTRLWCVMELFVYVRMGGKRERLVSRLLDDSTDLATRLAKFDAEDARCYLDNDRQKLLAVIEAAFGTFYLFNGLVRGIFSEATYTPTPTKRAKSGWRRLRKRSKAGGSKGVVMVGSPATAGEPASAGDAV